MKLESLKGDSLEGSGHTAINNPHILPLTEHFAKRSAAFKRLENRLWFLYLTRHDVLFSIFLNSLH